MTFDEFLAVTFILSAVLILAGFAILRQSKPQTMVKDVNPGETTTEHKRRVLRRVK